jgi:hypothetical protein
VAAVAVWQRRQIAAATARVCGAVGACCS